MNTFLKIFACLLLFAAPNQIKDWDKHLENSGYVDIQTHIPSIHTHLIYASSDNFLGESVYQGMTRAWLHRDAAVKLEKAQQILKENYPDHSLLVYDAARPMSVQRKMWALVRGTSKSYYVANPAKGGGLHNYGMAVDVTIIDTKTGEVLPMGTPVDFFGEVSHTDAEEYLLQEGLITQEALENRLLLRSVMRQAGFRTVKSEWWHFNACSRDYAVKNYPLIEP